MPSEQQQDGRRHVEEPQEQSTWDKVKWLLVLFLVSNMLTKFMPGPENNTTTKSSKESPSAGANGPKQLTLYPAWKRGSTFDIDLEISSHQVYDDSAIPYDSIKNVSFEHDGGINADVMANVAIPQDFLANNGTLWAHLLVRSKDEEDMYHRPIPITYHLPQKKKSKKKLLIGDNDNVGAADDDDVVVDDSPKIVPHFNGNVSFGFVDTWDPVEATKAHPAALQHVVQDESRRQLATDGHNEIGYYYPIIYNNQFWQLPSQMVDMTELPDNKKESFFVHFKIYQTPYWKFNLLSTMDFGLKQQAEQQAAGAAEIEELKRVLLETSPYLLAVTVTVSLLHTLFEFLAFKNDISHWKNKKDTIGVSVRTIVANVVMQFVIFLYLMDNNDNTNNMVLLTQGMGIFVEAWKITKAVNIRFNTNGKWIEVTDKYELSDVEKKTKEYDGIIFKYLYIVGVPLIGAYAIYSLLYEEHKSWVSFCITVAVQCVYAYGFLLLIPPVYINYRLKSVAHMSGRAMIYKTLNTFIDDLFSFVIKMPWLHRVMTLRDDVIFVIYLYQSWAYRVDYSRVNELGQGGGDVEEDQEETKKEK